MDIVILSLCPECFASPFSYGLLKKAQEKGLIRITCVDIRDFSLNFRQSVDDRPYGGGPGMVIKPEPVVAAIRSVKREGSRVIYLTPQGERFNHAACLSFAKEKHVIVVCGHYEGIDQRIIDSEVMDEVSIVDVVLTSGIPAAVVFVDAVSRLIPGVLGNEESARCDSFCLEDGTDCYFEGPQYTRPYEFEDQKVPDILLSGDPKKIDIWRKNKGKEKQKIFRPDLG